MSKILTIDNLSDNANVKTTTFLMKDYNEGRHGTWNNYESFKGMTKESYIYQTDSFKKSKIDEEKSKNANGLGNPRMQMVVGNDKYYKPM